ncbi:hypothetical protein ACQ4PT_011435 [Festuca glaucescens]
MAVESAPVSEAGFEEFRNPADHASGAQEHADGRPGGWEHLARRIRHLRTGACPIWPEDILAFSTSPRTPPPVPSPSRPASSSTVSPSSSPATTQIMRSYASVLTTAPAATMSGPPPRPPSGGHAAPQPRPQQPRPAPPLPQHPRPAPPQGLPLVRPGLATANAPLGAMHPGAMAQGGASMMGFQPLQPPSRKPGPPAYFPAPQTQQQFPHLPQQQMYAPPFSQFQAPAYPPFQQQPMPAHVGIPPASKNKRKKKKTPDVVPLGVASSSTPAPAPSQFPQMPVPPLFQQMPFLDPASLQPAAATVVAPAPVQPLEGAGAVLARDTHGKTAAAGVLSNSLMAVTPFNPFPRTPRAKEIVDAARLRSPGLIAQVSSPVVTSVLVSSLPALVSALYIQKATTLLPLASSVEGEEDGRRMPVQPASCVAGQEVAEPTPTEAISRASELLSGAVVHGPGLDSLGPLLGDTAACTPPGKSPAAGPPCIAGLDVGGAPPAAATGESSPTLSPQGGGHQPTPLQRMEAWEGPAASLPSLAAELEAASDDATSPVIAVMPPSCMSPCLSAASGATSPCASPAATSPPTSPMPVAPPRRVFAAFDQDGDGKISEAELPLCMKAALGGDMSAEEVQALMATADTDGDGFLDEEEFVTEASTQEAERQLMMTMLDLHLDVDECQAMIRRFDLNGDGVLTFDEFKTMMMIG